MLQFPTSDTLPKVSLGTMGDAQVYLSYHRYRDDRNVPTEFQNYLNANKYDIKRNNAAALESYLVSLMYESLVSKPFYSAYFMLWRGKMTPKTMHAGCFGPQKDFTEFLKNHIIFGIETIASHNIVQKTIDNYLISDGNDALGMDYLQNLNYELACAQNKYFTKKLLPQKIA